MATGLYPRIRQRNDQAWHPHNARFIARRMHGARVMKGCREKRAVNGGVLAQYAMRQDCVARRMGSLQSARR